MLNDKEKFAAEIIKEKFSVEYTDVSYTEGEDPPDIYLKYGSKKAAIELTELSQNLLKNRISVNKSYEKFIKNIDIQIPDYTHYLIVFHHANIWLNKARKKEILGFLRSPNSKMQKCINGIFVRIKRIPSKTKKGTISQISLCMNSCSRDINTVLASLMDFDIEGSFSLMINKAIETKKEKCKNIEQPVWLAMHDSYFSYIFSQNKEESIELYNQAMKNIDFGIFEKIIITFNNKKMVVFEKKIT